MPMSTPTQVYGNDEVQSSDGVAAHMCVRRCAVEYMRNQRRHFEPFVAGLRTNQNQNQNQQRARLSVWC